MPKSKTYEEFVEKFKPKLTTDDCITPPLVYQAVLDFVCAEYGIDPASVVRAFWPGQDYKREAYPAGCVVVDNPPFSILKAYLSSLRAECKKRLDAQGITEYNSISISRYAYIRYSLHQYDETEAEIYTKKYLEGML